LKKIIVYLFVFLSIKTYAQDWENFSGAFSETSIKVALKEISSKTSYTFFFKNEWIDSLNCTADFNQIRVDEVLNTIFKESQIEYFKLENQIILTNGIIIIDNPLISEYSENSKVEKAESESNNLQLEKGLIFSREYQEPINQDIDLEKRVFEIGVKSQFKPKESSTVAGYITDKDTGEGIIGVAVYTTDLKNSTISKQDGFYSLNVPSGKNEVYFQHLEMKRQKRNLVVFSNGKLDVEMELDVIALNEVVVEADKGANVESLEMGVNRLSVEEISNVPVVMGEKDILKVATTFAGVQTLGEGASGFNVRGGKSDQNLFLFDGATIYNASHFLGFFSVFNSDALSGLKIHKSGIPASLGGRLSSVFDITSKTASTEKVKAEGGISLITSRLTLELPVIKEKSSLLVSGRTTYSDWLLERFANADFSENRVAFSDLILKYNHKFSNKDNIRVTSYISADKFRLNSDTLFSFSNFSW